jgi:hypothetical protein
LLEALIALDPEPEDLPAALLRIVEELGPPTGPARSLAAGLYEEWQAAAAAPQWLGHLLDEATHRHARGG